MKIYLAATYSKYPIMQQITTRLMSLGFEVTSRWIQGLAGTPQHDALQDVQDVLRADTLIFFSDTPMTMDDLKYQSKGGRHTELGISIATGKRIILVGERENVFHHLPNVEVVADTESAIRLTLGL